MTVFDGHTLPTGAELETALKAHPSSGHREPEPALEEKIHYLYAQAKKLEALLEQAGPLIEKAGPMLEQAAPLLASFGGPASSPLGRIAGAFLR